MGERTFACVLLLLLSLVAIVGGRPHHRGDAHDRAARAAAAKKLKEQAKLLEEKEALIPPPSNTSIAHGLEEDPGGWSSCSNAITFEDCAAASSLFFRQGGLDQLDSNTNTVAGNICVWIVPTRNRDVTGRNPIGECMACSKTFGKLTDPNTAGIVFFRDTNKQQVQEDKDVACIYEESNGHCVVNHFAERTDFPDNYYPTARLKEDNGGQLLLNDRHRVSRYMKLHSNMHKSKPPERHRLWRKGQTRFSEQPSIFHYTENQKSKYCAFPFLLQDDPQDCSGEIHGTKDVDGCNCCREKYDESGRKHRDWDFTSAHFENIPQAFETFRQGSACDCPRQEGKICEPCGPGAKGCEKRGQDYCESTKDKWEEGRGYKCGSSPKADYCTCCQGDRTRPDSGYVKGHSAIADCGCPQMENDLVKQCAPPEKKDACHLCDDDRPVKPGLQKEPYTRVPDCGCLPDWIEETEDACNCCEREGSPPGENKYETKPNSHPPPEVKSAKGYAKLRALSQLKAQKCKCPEEPLGRYSKERYAEIQLERIFGKDRQDHPLSKPINHRSFCLNQWMEFDECGECSNLHTDYGGEHKPNTNTCGLCQGPETCAPEMVNGLESLCHTADPRFQVACSRARESGLIPVHPDAAHYMEQISMYEAPQYLEEEGDDDSAANRKYEFPSFNGSSKAWMEEAEALEVEAFDNDDTSAVFLERSSVNRHGQTEEAWDRKSIDLEETACRGNTPESCADSLVNTNAGLAKDRRTIGNYCLWVEHHPDMYGSGVDAKKNAIPRDLTKTRDQEKYYMLKSGTPVEQRYRLGKCISCAQLSETKKKHHSTKKTPLGVIVFDILSGAPIKTLENAQDPALIFENGEWIPQSNYYFSVKQDADGKTEFEKFYEEKSGKKLDRDSCMELDEVMVLTPTPTPPPPPDRDCAGVVGGTKDFDRCGCCVDTSFDRTEPEFADECECPLMNDGNRWDGEKRKLSERCDVSPKIGKCGVCNANGECSEYAKEMGTMCKMFDDLAQSAKGVCDELANAGLLPPVSA